MLTVYQLGYLLWLNPDKRDLIFTPQGEYGSQAYPFPVSRQISFRQSFAGSNLLFQMGAIDCAVVEDGEELD